MPDHRLEKITEDHLVDVLRIYNHYVLNSTATFHAQPLTLEEMRKLVFFAKPCHQTYVLLVDERCAGYAYVGPHKNRDAYAATGEISVYLQPGFAGKGFGRLALAHIEAHAHKHHFHVLLATICSQNANSLQLFLNHGFSQCAHYREVGRKFGCWLDVIVCQKILD